MMMRTQIQLEKEAYLTLQIIAKQSKKSISQLVRQSVDEHLKKTTSDHAWEQSLAAIGRFQSGAKDISVNHDHYLGDEW